MGKSILKILIILLVVFNAGYMLYDGYHALTVGDYIRPAEGEYAGQLGPWTMFASMADIDPMSATMMGIFVAFGVLGLLSLVLFIFRPRLGSTLLMLFCFLTLWNIMFGAMSSFVTIILILSWRKLYAVKHTTEAVREKKRTEP
jgi:hypothetical protein